MQGILSNIDGMEAHFLIEKLEATFNIEIKDDETLDIKIVGDLIDCIIDKIKLNEIYSVDACTSQRIFYKIRSTISKNNLITTDNLTPKTYLKDVLILKNRKKISQILENNFNISLNLLSRPFWFDILVFITGGYLFLELFFIDVLPFNYTIILSSIFIILLMAREQFKFEPTDKTIRDFVNRIKCENYMRFQVGNSFNENEIEGIVTYLLKDMLAFQKVKINRSTIL